MKETARAKKSRFKETPKSLQERLWHILEKSSNSKHTPEINQNEPLTFFCKLSNPKNLVLLHHSLQALLPSETGIPFVFARTEARKNEG